MMELTTQQKRILEGLVCPYCKQETELVKSEQVYGVDYGAMMYVCWDCNAYVGCHRNTTQAKGRVAKPQLRKLRREAHNLFDKLWLHKMNQGQKRKNAYKWLSNQLNIPEEYTHIGMFGERTCKRVIALCKTKNE